MIGFQLKPEFFGGGLQVCIPL